jgi:hypothetical protein
VGEEGLALDGERWRELWLQTVSGSLRKFWRSGEEEWVSCLWLEFDGAPVLRFTGFATQFDKKAPREGAFPEEDSFIKELTALPPFAEIVGTPLQAISVLAAGKERPPSTSGSRNWADRPPALSPSGVRLQFEGGDVWIMERIGEIHLHDQRPRRSRLSEWEYPA